MIIIVGSKITIAAIIISGLVIAINADKVIETLPWLNQGSGIPSTDLGQVTKVVGGALIQEPGSLTFSSLEQATTIQTQSTVRTHANSHVDIHFKNGFKLRVLDRSRLVFDQISSVPLKIVVSRIEGHWQLLDIGSNGDLLTDRDGALTSLKHFRQHRPFRISLANPEKSQQKLPQNNLPLRAPSPMSAGKKNTAPQQTRNTPPTKLPPKKPLQDEATETLSDTYIDNVIAGQMPFFNKCYRDFLQKKPHAQGSLQFTFLISPKGRVQNIKLVRGTLKNRLLIKCTATVLKRSRFRRFSGKPIAVTYPIDFQ